MGREGRMITRRPEPGPDTRLAPAQAFPPYMHEPGKTPHPYRHESGHSHGQPEPTVAPLDPSDCFESEAYLFPFMHHDYIDSLSEADQAWIKQEREWMETTGASEVIAAKTMSCDDTTP